MLSLILQANMGGVAARCCTSRSGVAGRLHCQSAKSKAVKK
jgi:hypothetical protein